MKPSTLLITFVTIALGNVAHARPVDPSFAEWLTSAGKRELRYREIAVRFLAAVGRDPAAYRRSMDALGERFRQHLGRRSPASKSADPRSPAEQFQALTRFFFREEGFRADLDLSRPDNLFPDAILERRRGYCLGLTLLLLDLAEQLEWPLLARSAPRHIFVQHGASPDLNLETTLNGEIHDENWYRERFDLRSPPRRSLLRALSPLEIAAHLINNHGFVQLEAGELAGAEHDFERTLRVAPRVVEAMINQGVLQARRGRFAEALARFDQALVEWPGDPELQQNRLNALVSLGRGAAAASDLASLIEQSPDPQKLTPLTEAVRGSLDEERDWDQIQALTTVLNARRAAAGKKRGLWGCYFRDRRFKERAFSRVDADLAFHWSWGSPGRGVPQDNFSIRWTGWLEIPRADEYTFYVACSDGIRMWIDGRLVLNAWRRANNNITDGKVTLAAGIHDLRVEYFETIGESGIQIILTAERERMPLDLSDHLFHPAE